jgi:hypothetical protein
MQRRIPNKLLSQFLALVLVLWAVSCSNLQQAELSAEDQRLSAGQKSMDSTVYYYKNSSNPSVVITDWNSENIRFVRLYDPFGNRTFTMEDIRSSYSNLTELRQFHENGAVSLLTITLNPDGSRYWYTSDITFGINNEPLWKEDFQHPEEHVVFPGINKSYWKDGHWIKQEIIQEQPVRKD